MDIFRISKISSLTCVLLTMLLLTAHNAIAQSATVQQLRTLVPYEQDLQGFVCVVPQGEFLLPETWSQGDQKWERLVSPSVPVEDDIALNLDADQLTGFWRPITEQVGKYSFLRRCLWSTDGAYQLEIRVTLCDSATTAHKELEEICQQSQVSLIQGAFSSSIQLGDESWVYPPSEENVIRGRCGKILFTVAGQPSRAASRSAAGIIFPAQAVEAVAYQILLRAAQQPELTGVTPEQASVNINGHALPKSALLVCKQVYVPVAEFAKAMGLTSQWNAKTGALTLSGAGHKTVALTAGSTAAKVGGMAAAALKVPVLKQAGQPLMTLDDLLTLTGGRVTGHSGNTVQVKA